MIPSEIYKELISIGKKGKLDKLPKLADSFPPTSSDAWLLYDNSLSTKYESNDLISLFRGLVICEKELRWHCGSTTPAAHLYQDINNLGLDQDYSLADWAFQYSDNEYIPFGFIRHGEQTAYEYIQWREDLHSRLIQEKIDKEERKERQLERAKEIEKRKRERDRQRRQLYQKILEMPPEEQVEVILSDDKHLVYYYMPVIRELLNNNSATLQDLGKLMSRLITMKDTPFSKKLIKQIKKKRLHLFLKPKPKYTNSEETLQKLALIEKEVDAKVEEILKDEPRKFGFCHLFWGTKKRLLKEEYGIDWLTPAECHPDYRFD